MEYTGGGDRERWADFLIFLSVATRDFTSGSRGASCDKAAADS